MLRQALSAVLIVVLLTGSLLRLSKVVEFAVYYDHVVTELCEQRNEVVNTCNGSCHLSKSVKSVEEAEAEAPLEQPSRLVIPELVYTSHFDGPVALNDCSDQRFIADHCRALGGRLIDGRLFQPPRRA